MALISARVAAARAGRNDRVIARIACGWAVIGDVRFVPGYCLLMPDPVVPSLDHLAPGERIRFLAKMALVGDAVPQVTGARRINDEILGNAEAELHAHIFPRFDHEPAERAFPRGTRCGNGIAPALRRTGGGSGPGRLRWLRRSQRPADSRTIAAAATRPAPSAGAASRPASGTSFAKSASAIAATRSSSASTGRCGCSPAR
jgi:diadenosine tetraphosphate (Ap4A) HIT family hydrolase